MVCPNCINRRETGFINNYSRFHFHLPLHTKDKVSTRLEEVLAALPSRVHMQTVHSDCGGEFKSMDFEEVLHNRIKFETTPGWLE